MLESYGRNEGAKREVVNAQPQRRGAKRVKMQTGAANPRPLQAVR